MNATIKSIGISIMNNANPWASRLQNDVFTGNQRKEVTIALMKPIMRINNANPIISPMINPATTKMARAKIHAMPKIMNIIENMIP